MARSWSIELSVVGLRFRTRTIVRDALVKSTPFRVDLVRERDNRFDENAIKVVIGPKFKYVRLRGQHMGYLTREAAARLAPALDEGRTTVVRASVTEVGTGSDPEAKVVIRFSDTDNPKVVRRRK